MIKRNSKATGDKKQETSINWGILVLFGALVVGYLAFGVLAKPGQSFALCNYDPNDPGSCQPRACYEPPSSCWGPSCTRCDYWCGDSVIQGGRGEDCDPPQSGVCTNSCKFWETDPPPPTVQCNNGRDDDGDGYVDAGDPGCDPDNLSTDNDETNNTTWYSIHIVDTNFGEAIHTVFGPHGQIRVANDFPAGSPSRWGNWIPGDEGYPGGALHGEGTYTLFIDSSNWNPPGWWDATIIAPVPRKNYIFMSEAGTRSVNWRVLYEMPPAPLDPTTPTVAPVGACATGSTGYNANISWTGTAASYGFYVDVSNDSGFTGYWRKTVASGLSTTAPAGFTPMGTASGALQFSAGVAYYARVTGSLGTSGSSSFSLPLCTYKACNWGTLTCDTFPGTSTDSCSTNAQCGVPPPTCNFTATPDRVVIPPPAASTLSWDCQNVTACQMDQGIGSVNASGTSGVSPTSTTTYHLTCTGNTLCRSA